MRVRVREGKESWLHSQSSLLLGFFSGHVLVRITDTLALIGLRLTISADIGRDLADHLLVRALDHDSRLPRLFDREAFGHRIPPRFRVSRVRFRFFPCTAAR